MSVFDDIRSNLAELLKLTKESATYCAQVAMQPSLATDASHAREIAREHRIVELSTLLGIR